MNQIDLTKVKKKLDDRYEELFKEGEMIIRDFGLSELPEEYKKESDHTLNAIHCVDAYRNAFQTLIDGIIKDPMFEWNTDAVKVTLDKNDDDMMLPLRFDVVTPKKCPYERICKCEVGVYHLYYETEYERRERDIAESASILRVKPSEDYVDLGIVMRFINLPFSIILIPSYSGIVSIYIRRVNALHYMDESYSVMRYDSQVETFFQLPLRMRTILRMTSEHISNIFKSVNKLHEVIYIDKDTSTSFHRELNIEKCWVYEIR